MTATDKDSRYGMIVATVNSRSAPGVNHVVRSKDGVLSCNCKGWIFSKRLPRSCRHTVLVGWQLDPETAYKDKATLICNELLDVIGHTVPPGTLARMAGALRPYLGATVQRTVAPAVRNPQALVMGASPRRITLDE